MEFSIITINYNNKKGLQKTTNSVISQTFKDYEWIIIDGGSTDGSKELIEGYAQHITYWVSESDKGIYNAMNKGILQAKGEYLLFLNSGDWLIDSNVLEKVHSSLPKKDIIYGYVARTLNNELTNLTGFLHKDDITISDLYFQTIPHQGTFFKKDLFEKYGYYNDSLKIVGDREFYIRTIIYGNASVKFLPLTISYSEEGGISATSKEYPIEKQKVLQELIPPRIYTDMIHAISKKEICKRRFFRFLYSCLYLLATTYEKYFNNKLR